jgi:predicted SnoaL-like aldol condensation-catalyzing enzyme
MMKRHTNTGFLVLLAVASLCIFMGCATTADHDKGSAMATKQAPDQLESNRQTVVSFYEAGLNKKDFDAAHPYLGSSYKQHNPNAADGVEGFRGFVAYSKEHTPNSHSEIKHAFADGDFVILHVHKTTGPDDRGVAIIDIFRLENGKIVEHWDVTQVVPERTASGNPMF